MRQVFRGDEDAGRAGDFTHGPNQWKDAGPVLHEVPGNGRDLPVHHLLDGPLGVRGELEAAEDGLPVPHELQLGFLRGSHLQDEVVVVDGGGVRSDARPCLAVVGVRKLGMDPGSGLDHHLVAVGDEQPDRVGIEGHASFLQGHLLGDADAQALLMRAEGELLLLGRQRSLEGQAADAFLGFHG